MKSWCVWCMFEPQAWLFFFQIGGGANGSVSDALWPLGEADII